MSRWNTLTIGELVTSVKSWNPLRENQEEAFNYIDLSAVDQAAKTIIGARKTICSEAPSRARQLVSEGDVLVSTVRPNLNGTAKITAEYEGATASTGFCVLRPRSDFLSSNYLFQWVKSPQFVTDMVGKATGASYPAVSDRIIRESSIPVPPLAEQRRIAAILDQADALRAKRREALAQLDSLTQSIFIEMFGDPKIQIAAGVCSLLSDVVAPGRIVTYGIVQAGPEVSDGVPYIRTGDIKNGVILEDRLSRTSPEIAQSYSRSAIQTGDIVMSIRATVGTTALVPNSLTGANLTQGTARISPGEDVQGNYLLSYLRTDSVQAWIQSNVKGATFREITLGKLRELPVFVPPIDLQKIFTERVAVVNSMIATARRASAELDALFFCLQHRAFRGDL